MSTSSDIDWIQEWFLRHCDGEWEHGEGIVIKTLDNPGWAVSINVKFTPLESRPFTTVDERFRSDDDWVRCVIDEGKFQGWGGPSNLGELLGIFRAWADEPKS